MEHIGFVLDYILTNIVYIGMEINREVEVIVKKCMSDISNEKDDFFRSYFSDFDYDCDSNKFNWYKMNKYFQ